MGAFNRHVTMRGYFNASKMHWLVITLSSFSTLFFKNTSFERHVANRIWQQDEKCIIVGARRDTIFLQLSSISLKFLVISNSRTIILLHCKYWMNITPWASLKSLVEPCSQIIYVCLDLSEDHNLSRCHILKNPVTKFRNSEKMLHKIWYNMQIWFMLHLKTFWK